MTILRTTMLAIGLVALAAGCGNKNKKAPAAPTTSEPAATEGDAAAPSGEDNPCGTDVSDPNPCK